MLFPTITFAIFFIVVLPVNWLLIQRPYRWSVFILAASYFFYGYYDWRFCFLLAGSTLVNQFVALRIFRSEREAARRAWLAAGVVANLGGLAYFKYYDFFVSNATNALARLGLGVSPTIVAVALPIGISFFTFQALSYIVDVYRRTFEPRTMLEFAVYLSFFPHVVSGPIVRAAEFLPQLRLRHDPRRVDSSRAFFLIFIGLFKKVVIANFLGTNLVDIVFANPKQHGSLEVLVAVYAYAIQIYADFSGYTDMAIGLALLLGFRFPQNFDRPYTATSLQDFWRRWHMTLSRWLRDYLYIPLGGDRKGRWRTYRNIMITFLLGGLWHGASWTFVVWGGIHGSFLSYEHWQRTRRAAAHHHPAPDRWRGRLGRRLFIFNVVCLGWVFFRADSFSNAADVLTQIFDPAHWGQAAPLVTGGVLLAIGAGLLEQYIPRDLLARAMSAFSRLTPAAQGVALGVALLLTNTMGPRGVAPFIYFRF
ncbi:MAG TPA: MBOAT family protein [Acidimicrobiia bacterium]|jgi:D-alanyl-lipoteichoic acid acyltransferase DltB (MBOAT superfamily)|nr:MBOAT family protein [Acidimicrobiia bacterium]HEV3451116.1 MBOAT family protein [Acidimicrobiia bacterium]